MEALRAFCMFSERFNLIFCLLYYGYVEGLNAFSMA